MKAKYIETASQNGVGRYVCQLQRVVLKFCKSHGGSRGMRYYSNLRVNHCLNALYILHTVFFRDFIEDELVNYAKTRPGVVVYLKPRRHRAPVIAAEFRKVLHHNN